MVLTLIIYEDRLISELQWGFEPHLSPSPNTHQLLFEIFRTRGIQNLKLEGCQYNAGGLSAALMPQVGPGQSPIGDPEGKVGPESSWILEILEGKNEVFK